MFVCLEGTEGIGRPTNANPNDSYLGSRSTEKKETQHYEVLYGVNG